MGVAGGVRPQTSSPGEVYGLQPHGRIRCVGDFQSTGITGRPRAVGLRSHILGSQGMCRFLLFTSTSYPLHFFQFLQDLQLAAQQPYFIVSEHEGHSLH